MEENISEVLYQQRVRYQHTVGPMEENAGEVLYQQSVNQCCHHIHTETLICLTVVAY